jgi:hypothetical protein
MRHKALVIFAMTLVLATAAWASSESVLYSFNSFTGDGYYPYSGLVAAGAQSVGWPAPYPSTMPRSSCSRVCVSFRSNQNPLDLRRNRPFRRAPDHSG